MASVGAKIVTLSVTDQNLLRVALDRALAWGTEPYITDADIEITERIKDLKARLV